MPCNEGLMMTIPLDDSQDPMPPNPVTVSDPVVTGVGPVSDDSTGQESSKEAYSERGLSGEAAVNTEGDEEVFENVDYDDGFRCGRSGGQNDDTKSETWQRGWVEAQE
jgi:hypothetical protein